MANSFKELLVWQRAMDLAEAVFGLTRQWPAEHRFGIASQAQRAATSVPANLAEGHERRTRNEFLRYIAIASGSLAELETHLFLASRAGLCPEHKVAEPIQLAHEIGRMLRTLEKRVRRQAANA